MGERHRLENCEQDIQYEIILGNDGNSAPISHNYSETIKAGSFYLDNNNTLVSIQKYYADGNVMVECTIVESDIPESVRHMVENSVSESHQEAVFTKGEWDWYVLLPQKKSTELTIYVSKTTV